MRTWYGRSFLTQLLIAGIIVTVAVIGVLQSGSVYAAPSSILPVSDTELYTEESVIIKFEGTGVGMKTLEHVCREFAIPLETARNKLKARGLNVEPLETFKVAAKRNGVYPITILQAVLVGEPARK